jgi:hypothetical protein
VTEPNMLPTTPRPDPWAGVTFETEITINRQRLLRHLRRLRCAHEVVFDRELTCTAMEAGRDQCLAVHTPGLPEIAPLSGPIGVKVDPLINTLNCLEADDLELRIEGDHLVLASEHRRIRHRTIAPDLIVTRVSERKLFEKISKGEWQEIDAGIATGVVQAIRALGVGRNSDRGLVAIRVGPEGMTIIVGDRISHSVEFDVPGVTVDDSYTVLLPPDRVQAVLSEVGDSRLAICLIGPDAVVGLRFESQDDDVEAIFVISPLEEVRGPRGDLPDPIRKGVPEGFDEHLLATVYEIILDSGRRHLPSEELLSALRERGMTFTWQQPAGELASVLDTFALKPKMCSDTGRRGYYLKDIEIALGIDKGSDAANPAISP